MDSRIGFAFAIVTNLMLTGLTAGRIWWTRRELRIVGQENFAQRYTTAISVMCVAVSLHTSTNIDTAKRLESGAAYSMFLVLVIVALSLGRTATSGPTATLASFSYGAAGQLVVSSIITLAFFLYSSTSRRTSSPRFLLFESASFLLPSLSPGISTSF
jgi:hypothetical protein